jgi:hypothetical protein
MPVKIEQNTHVWCMEERFVERLEYSVEQSFCEVLHITGYMHFINFFFLSHIFLIKNF